MPADKSTPRPWALSDIGFTTNEGQIPIMAKDEEMGRRRVALVDRQTECKRKDAWQAPDPIRDANAKLIVRAVNNRDKLVSALEELLSHETSAINGTRGGEAGVARTSGAFIRARAVLAEVKRG